jgi:hypothetical protein
MSFQAYLDTIRDKTGLGPDDFLALAEQRGFLAPDTKATAVTDWLKADYGLGHGHAMAIYSLVKARMAGGRKAPEARAATLFSGDKAQWQPVADQLVSALAARGDVGQSPTDTYLSLTRGKAKVVIIQPGKTFCDLGIKFKSRAPTERFAAAGSWNNMVTHRVRLNAPAALDADILEWVHAAWDAA